MNYERHYTKLMLRASGRTIDGYTEKHHWYPRALYPQWEHEDWNIVRLTAREHFVAHWLLHRWLGGAMTYAFWRMCNCKRYESSTAYDEARRAFQKRTSEDNTGNKNPMYGTISPNRGKTPSEDTKLKLSKSQVKYAYTGTHKHTGEQVGPFIGGYELNKAGFVLSAICQAVKPNTRNKGHRGYIWKRNTICN